MADMDDVVGAEGFISPGGSGRAVRWRQPPDFEPLVVVCECVGLGAGGVGGGVTVGLGVAL
jgi:phage-related protein